MSKTHCRFCDITVQGIYLNCPRCGKWLAPNPPREASGLQIPPEPFTLVEYGPRFKPETATESVQTATVAAGQLAKIISAAIVPAVEALSKTFKSISSWMEQHHIKLLASGYRIENKRGRNKLVIIERNKQKR